MSGRGAWTKRGMPSNGSQYYELVTPVNVGSQPGLDQDHRAVMFGVRTIQMRVNELGYLPALSLDGWLGPNTSAGIVWAQKRLGVATDGQAGPATLKAMLWPYIKTLPYDPTVLHTVGGICQHESGYDPGAVGFQDADDLGLVQINGPANPALSEIARFDYHVAFRYAADRIRSALGTPHFTLDAAIASYGYPSVAQFWVNSQTETFPQNPALNQLALDYVKFIKGWQAPS